ncbi:TPA: type VI secretion system ATPase TssH [Salmonella enterica]|uniref:type VI secretion system ATPase TssH n=1 Tax=Salmonella enterica TaxID=28901 RepID=UPI00127A805E|nr:type VI secretion system ATPase TssH [Salmonella enterica]EDA3267925.1 type VI secretion system ATPase TssH [Salmonella enterica subsp. enterica serovar Bovismorbificans]EIU5772760.1 type VI secretion system ATPase TssH [Salmonella enterica]NYA57890.1 type VI secretion system ATPase TssH [Salmonella enterica]HCL5276514.1 type VI secretion system ATPase TssH [Salmonella enterica]
MSIYLKSIINKLTPESRSTLDSAVNYAISRSHHEVDCLHFLWRLLQEHNYITEKFYELSIFNPDTVLNAIENELLRFNAPPQSSPIFSESMQILLEKTWLHASTKWQCNHIDIPVFWTTLINIRDSIFPYNVSETLYCDIDEAEKLLISFSGKEEYSSRYSMDKSPHKYISKYTENFSLLAEAGKLDPVTGREREIRQLIDILLRRRQNNPILTGEPGVGKSSIVEGLALQIASGRVPDVLKNVKILALDMGALLAGASVRGEFENRLKSLLTELNSLDGTAILFIDEAHSLIGAGGLPGQTDAANLLKPALARGELRIIAATTWGEYKKYFEKDGALARRFQIVKVTEPNQDVTAGMLRSLLPMMEKHHNVCIREEAITATVHLSDRYLHGRHQPDKSVSLLDTACSRVAVSQSTSPDAIQDIKAKLARYQGELALLTQEKSNVLRQEMLVNKITQLERNLDKLKSAWLYQSELVAKIQSTGDISSKNIYRKELESAYKKDSPMVFECVDKNCVADVVSGWTGVPLGVCLDTEKQKTSGLLRCLEQRVLGQRYAMSAIASQILICRADLKDPAKPDGVFLLAGPSGTGKTETARALAEFIYGDEKKLITINMTEFQEAHTVSTLKGAPPGYVGFGLGGTLTERVSHNPYSVILLDEIEKAHPDVLEFFFQIFDLGVIEDSEGKMVSFRDCLIIMTSNLASEKITSVWDDGKMDNEKIKEMLLPFFNNHFGAAFMGRANLIPFTPLNTKILKEIALIKIDKVCQRFERASGQMCKIEYSDSLIDWITHNCQCDKFGARDIDVVLNKAVLPVLARYLIDSEVKKTTKKIRISVRKNNITLRNL